MFRLQTKGGNVNRNLIVLILILCFSVPLCSAENKPSELNSILASVNGIPVSLMDVLPMTREKEYRAFSAYTGDELKQQIVAIRRQGYHLEMGEE